MDFSVVSAYQTIAGVVLLILLNLSVLVPTQAKTYQGEGVHLMPREVDRLRSIVEILSPEKCYRGSDGIENSCKWPRGVFVYDMDDALFSPYEKNVLTETRKQITEMTGSCITFRRKTDNDTTYIFITKGKDCSTPVGRRIGRAEMSMAKRCFTSTPRNLWATYMHLLSLGLWLEHARADRDSYVKIIEENIIEEYLPLFKKINGTSHGTPYDYGSILHPSRVGFSENGNETIETIVPDVEIGKKKMSILDALKLKNLYGCT